MCDYLCSIQNEIPVPVIKAVLFNISVNIKYLYYYTYIIILRVIKKCIYFQISFVSHHAVNAISSLAFATKKLVALINSQIIDLVFTHHPALLYFLFATSIIPEKIQLQLVNIIRF